MATNVSPLPFHLHLVGGPHGFQAPLKCTRSCPPNLRLLKDVRRTHCRQAQLESYHLLLGGSGLGGKSSRSEGSRAEHPLTRAGQEQRSGPAWPARGQGPSSCAAASVAPRTVPKAVPCTPSRCTKGHIDWFVGAFPGVLYISLPRHRNEEAGCSEEGRGRHTSIRMGFFILSIRTLIRHVREGSSILGRAAIFIKRATSLITVH